MLSPSQDKVLTCYVNMIHELLMDQINGIRAGERRLYKQHRLMYIRMFGQLLYEAPKIHTGKVSVKLVEQKLKDFSTKPCQDHHHSRQNGGLALVRLIDRAVSQNIDPTKNHVKNIALRYCQVHFTTKQENMALRRHQKKCSSEAAYRRTGIVLIDARELFTHRGRHNDQWKEAMRAKYQPIINDVYSTHYPVVEVDVPPIIN